jgi:hypothetical protein
MTYYVGGDAQDRVLRRETMISGRSMILVCGCLVAAALPLPAQGDKVQGTVTVGTTKVTLTSGMAVAFKAPNGQLISVVLSDKPVDAKEFATDTKTGPGEPLVAGLFEGAWKSQHIAKKFSGVTFTIGPNGLMSEEFLVGGRNNTFSIGNDEYVLDVKSRSPRLVGTLKTKAPAVSDRKAALDATFDIAVAAR